MKKIVIVFILFAFSVYAQNLTGFRNIEWGAKSTSVISKTWECKDASTKSFKVQACIRSDELLKIGEMPIDEVMYFFIDGKFSGAIISKGLSSAGFDEWKYTLGSLESFYGKNELKHSIDAYMKTIGQTHVEGTFKAKNDITIVFVDLKSKLNDWILESNKESLKGSF